MNSKGFTLIELMIAVLILGILLGIALPSYQNQLENTRRSDAKVSLLEVMNRQDVFKSNYGTYTTVITGPGGCSGVACGLNMSSTSKEGYYTITAVAGPTPSIITSVSLTATPVAGGIQANDACANLLYDSTGQKSISGTGARCW